MRQKPFYVRNIVCLSSDAGEGVRSFFDDQGQCYNFIPYAYHLGTWSLSLPFYSGDRDEPAHAHVERERNKAKFWLDPVRLQNSGGYNRNEINRIQRLIEDNQRMLLEK